MEQTITDILINSIGAVSVAIAFLWFLDRNEKRNTELIKNHLQHSTEALGQMSIAITKLVSVIESLKRFIKNNSQK